MSRTAFTLGALAGAALTGAGLAGTAELQHRRALRLTRSLVLPAGQTAADQATAWNATADRRAAEWHADTVERIRTNGGPRSRARANTPPSTPAPSRTTRPRRGPACST